MGTSDDIATTAAAGPSRPLEPGVGSWLDRALVGLLSRALAGAQGGRLHVSLPSGRAGVVGPAGCEVAASVALTNYRGLWKMARRGLNGFADAYMAGDIGSDDLDRLFTYYIDSERAFPGLGRYLSGASWLDRLYHRRRGNSRAGSRRNIAAHYDLGNAFYRLWLDAGLTYSSGIYRSPDDTLEMAQTEKYRRILEALRLEPHHRLLEIGCGWGGLAEEVASRAGHVTGITISREQHAEASARMRRHGLTDRVEVRLQDYRDTAGRFDRIASIEMIEAVGEEHWPTYFGVVADRLAPGGEAVIQAITIRPDLYETYRRNPDFIQRYIFPGGMLPTVPAMQAEAEAAGLAFETVETFGPSYARTLEDWRHRFLLSWPRIAALGYDQRFQRMWNYYLCYCAAGFRCGTIDVGLYRLVKPR